jgi:hypothetical protein
MGGGGGEPFPYPQALPPTPPTFPPSPLTRRILTHDFTHRTHASIFGFQYPRALPDWSSDDWVTYVYSAFGLQTKLPEVVVGHTFVLGTRYEPTAKSTRLMALNSELQSGAKAIADWLTEFKGTTIPYNVKNVECC